MVNVKDWSRELREVAPKPVSNLIERLRDGLPVSNYGRPSILDECAAEIERLRSELEAANKRLDWLELHLFDGKWDGTIGVPKTWHMAGPYRHTMQRMKGNTLRIAIDAAIAGETT